MDPEDPSCVSAVRAHFLSEAGGHAGIADGKVFWLQPLISQEGCDWLLRCGNQILLVHRIVIRFLTSLPDHLNKHISGKAAILCRLGSRLYRGSFTAADQLSDSLSIHFISMYQLQDSHTFIYTHIQHIIIYSVI